LPKDKSTTNVMLVQIKGYNIAWHCWFIMEKLMKEKPPRKEKKLETIRDCITSSLTMLWFIFTPVT